MTEAAVDPRTRLGWLTPTFFASGAAALLYQIAWERVLFTIFGVTTEAVTVVVTAFLLGLGVGSLVGGWVSERPSIHRLRWFAGAELGVAAFGAGSIPLFHAVGAATLDMAPAGTTAVTFLLVLLPTTCMGATLPLLVAYAVRACGSVGWSVGTLYHVNTAGSAIASVVAVTAALPFLGLRGTVWLAMACNLGAAALALRQERREAPCEAPCEARAR